MAYTSAYTPPAGLDSRTSGVFTTAMGIPTAANFNLDADDSILILSVVTTEGAIVTDFSIDVPDSSTLYGTTFRTPEISDICVRVTRATTGLGGVRLDSINAQLYWDGSVQGTSQSSTSITGAYDVTFSGFDTIPTLAQVESTGFGVQIIWQAAAHPQCLFDGVSIVAVYDPLYTVDERIYQRLSNYSNLTDLVSTRIFPIKAPQGLDNPYVVFKRISGVPEHAMGADPEVEHSRFQIGCYAKSIEDVNSIAIAVTSALSRWNSSTDTQQIQEVFKENEFSIWEDIDASDVGIWQQQLDFIVHSHKSSST